MIPLRASGFVYLLYVGDGGGQTDIYISSSAGLRVKGLQQEEGDHGI